LRSRCSFSSAQKGWQGVINRGVRWNAAGFDAKNIWPLRDGIATDSTLPSAACGTHAQVHSTPWSDSGDQRVLGGRRLQR
jgi:hypothetical protein